jgi:hypothetical protein
MTTLPTVSFLLAESWRYYKKQAKLLFLIQISRLLMITGVLFLTIVAFGIFWGPADPFSAQGRFTLLIGTLVSVSAFCIVGFWGQAAAIYAVTSTLPHMTVANVYSRSWKFLKSYTWTSFLMALAVIGGFFVFIIPGFIAMTWLFASQFILITENLHGRAALHKSHMYVNRAFWPALGRLLCGGLIYMAINFFVALILQQTHNTWANNLTSVIMSIFVSPFFLIYTYRLFLHLKKLHK